MALRDGFNLREDGKSIFLARGTVRWNQATHLNGVFLVLQSPRSSAAPLARCGAAAGDADPPSQQCIGLESLLNGHQGGLGGANRDSIRGGLAARASLPGRPSRRSAGGRNPTRTGDWCRARGVARCSSSGAACDRQDGEEQAWRAQPDSRHGQNYETLRVCRFMKSIRMNCPSVIVLVKYAFPLQMDATCFTKSTRLRSRASMKVLIMIPLRRQLETSR